MPILNYTTTKSAYESIGQIVAMLVKHGARKIVQDYTEDEHVAAISFTLETPMGPRLYCLPANADKVLAVMQRQKITRVKVDFAQAERVAWRILKDWVEAQLAILESEQVTMDQILLPYMVNGAGQTVYELYCSHQLLIGSPDDE